MKNCKFCFYGVNGIALIHLAGWCGRSGPGGCGAHSD